MTPAFELAAFAVRDGEEAAMLAARPAMVEALHRAFPGLLAAWLSRRDDGSWLDVILRRTRAEAETAAQHVNDVPEAKAWFRHIAQPHGLEHLDIADQRLFTAGPGHAGEHPDDLPDTPPADAHGPRQPPGGRPGKDRRAADLDPEKTDTWRTP